MRVASLNIHRGRGIDGKVDLERLATFLAESQADLIGLQEVAQTSRQNQPEILAQALGMQAAFFPSLKRCAFRYGNVILSQRPAFRVEGYPLPSLREKRSLLVAQFKQPAFTAAVAHLGLSGKERQEHAKRILELLPPSGPVILMGDWNANSSAPEVQAVLARLGDAFQLGQRSENDTHTFLSRQILPHRIDYIFVRGLRVCRYHTRGTIATDHRLVAADLDFN